MVPPRPLFDLSQPISSRTTNITVLGSQTPLIDRFIWEGVNKTPGHVGYILLSFTTGADLPKGCQNLAAKYRAHIREPGRFDPNVSFSIDH